MKYSCLVILFLFAAFGHSRAAELQVQRLRCEMLDNPEGIDVVHPRLSWEITGTARGIRQVAYQVWVASSREKLDRGEADLWNSGRVATDRSIHVLYAGKTLTSRQPCFWKVKVFTNTGAALSSAAWWSMGLLQAADWHAAWIGMDRSFPWDQADTQFSRLSARYLRKAFALPQQWKQAKLYISGLGLYEVYINGTRIGNQVLAPSPTDYTRTVHYNTYDVTQALRQGANAVGVILGNGRYFTMRQHYKPKKIQTFGYPKLLLQLEITCNDGSVIRICSDGSWKLTADGPIRTNNEYDGEEYDAGKAMQGWDLPGFADQHWLPAEKVQAPGGRLKAQMHANMRVMATLHPVTLTPLGDTAWLLDMGQNMAGWLAIRLNSTTRDTVTLRFAERLDSTGTLFTRNLRDAKATDRYIGSGEGPAQWEPRFVYHGFRYVEIRGFPGKPSLADFEGKLVYDDMATTGRFHCSDSTLNQVYHNAYWSICSNYKGMPVDCPQRNERMPWLGDRTTGALGESFVFDNAALYAKWLNDIADAQTPEGAIPDVAPAFWRYYTDNVTWPAAYIFIADMLHRQYGDLQPIAVHYASMKKWMQYMQARYLRDGLMKRDKYGDWCVPPESPHIIRSRDTSRLTDGTLIATAYYFRLLQHMRRFALLLHKPGDAATYLQQAQQVQTAFNRRFLNRQTGQYANNTVTANLLPLYFGITPAVMRARVFEAIVRKTVDENKGHVSSGVIGVQWLMRGLSQNGRPDLAYRMASASTYPGWGYMAAQGATTTWELWNGHTADPGMNSYNHVMLLGDLVTWLYEQLGGIQTSETAPAFKQLVMKPLVVQGLNEVSAAFHSMYGLIESEWKNTGGQFEWHIRLPPNTSALVYIPAQNTQQVRENNQPVVNDAHIRFVRMEGDRAVFEIGSGDYRFRVSHTTTLNSSTLHPDRLHLNRNR
jgi:alpha-L-rhamnosidase